MPIRQEMRARYPKDWAVRSRFVRLFRARGRCEWCGLPQYSVVERQNGGGWLQASPPFASFRDARQSVAERYAAQFGADGFEENCPWTVVVLTCAHIFDDRPEACSLLNLAALCQRCHNRHDAPARRAGARLRAREHTGDLFQIR